MTGVSTPDLSTVSRRLDDIAIFSALSALVSLSMPEFLDERPRPADALAAEAAVDGTSLRRLLNVAVAIGTMSVDDDGAYALTPAGGPLLRDHPDSCAAELANTDFQVAWSRLEGAVAQGIPAYEVAFGSSFYDRLAADPAQLRRFQTQMSNRASAGYVALLGAPCWPATGTCIDIGGGTGTLAAAVSAARPQLDVTLFERAEVVALATTDGKPREPAPFRLAAGDALRDVPGPFDRYVIASLIHNLGDGDAAQLLSNVARTMTPRSRVLVIERTQPSATALSTAVADLWMLAMLGGCERTRGELEYLGERAGLTLTAVHTATTTDFAIHEFSTGQD